MHPMIKTSLGCLISAPGKVQSVAKVSTHHEPTLDGHEAFDCLKEDAHTQRQQENAIKKGSKKRGPLPPERQLWRGVFTLRRLAVR